MQSLTKSLTVVVCLVALGSIGTMMNHFQNPGSLRADTDRGPTVTIAAPLPLPVNVTGTPGVNVNNTPNVHVTNSPAVLVGNTSSSPVLTRSVDNSGLHPFQFLQTGSQMAFRFTVPVGNTLVIEHVSLSCFEPPASAFPTDFRLVVNDASYFFVPTTFAFTNITELITNQVTHIYAYSGSTVIVGDGGGSPPGSTCEAAIVGHLVSSL